MITLLLSGLNTDSIRNSDNDGLIPTTLRLSPSLFHVSWREIISKELPLATGHKIDNILHIGGQFSINPLLLITKILMDDKKNLRYLTQSDKEFNRKMISFANFLSKHDQDFYTENHMDHSSSLHYALHEIFDSPQYIRNFIMQCKYSMNKYNIPETTIHDRNIREASMDIVLDLPYPSSECWAASATHYGAIQLDELGKYAMSAIDFSPTLFGHWGVKFDYLNSEGSVHTAHAGRIKWHSDCSIEVEDLTSSYSTYYSHIILAENIADKVLVLRGQLIGWIDLYSDGANCNCDWGNKMFECASGPHVHFELRRNGYPVSLNNRVLSKYRIKAGTFPHDKQCSDPESCEFAKNNGLSCATLYTDITTGIIYCPTVKGQNLGKTYKI